MIREFELLVTCCLLSACGKFDSLPDGDMTAGDCLSAAYVCIRMENATDIDFDSFDVQFNNQIENFGGLRAGQVSSYRRIDRAYRYAYTEAFSGERRFVLQPIDFMGETPVLPGIYTYQYSAEVLDEPLARDDWVLHGYMGVTFKADMDGT